MVCTRPSRVELHFFRWRKIEGRHVENRSAANVVRSGFSEPDRSRFGTAEGVGLSPQSERVILSATNPSGWVFGVDPRCDGRGVRRTDSSVAFVSTPIALERT